jgi:hypothetical protein
MDMSDKVKYKYSCKYCGKEWELSYQVRNPNCHFCKDENVKCEEVKIKDYYGTNKNQIDFETIHWWTWRD